VRRLHARWVLPIGAPPLRDGTVVLDDTRIHWVGARSSAPAASDDHDLDLGDAVLLPGLVNAHTHLDLAPLTGVALPRDFPAWIRALVGRTAAAPAETLRAGALWAARDQLAHGVTTVADTAPNRFAFDAMRAVGLRGIAFRETFGPDPAHAPTALRALHAAVTEMRRDDTALVRTGVSPHAPYSVSDPLYRAVAAYAASEALPVAVHIAESEAESALVESGTGAFAEYLRDTRGIAVAPRGTSPLAALATLGLLTTRPLCIHAVRLSTDDVRRVADHGASVAHCPCSNAWFGHGSAPIAALRQQGVPVGLGTDSIASNTQLRVRLEARAAADATLSFADRLALATHGGATALGLGDRIGRLDPGFEADLVAFAIHDAAEADADPARYVLELPPDARPLLTLVAGRDRTVTDPVLPPPPCLP
jgi:cytosine/adenosine deaminase-related metal-dependent hydrolase